MQAIILLTLWIGVSAQAQIPSKTVYTPRTATISTKTALDTSPQVKLTVSPANQLAPGTIQLRVQATPHPKNRALCVGYDGDNEHSRRSCWDLAGEQAPRFFQTRYNGLPSGAYRAYVELWDTNSILAETSATFLVL